MRVRKINLLILCFVLVSKACLASEMVNGVVPVREYRDIGALFLTLRYPRPMREGLFPNSVITDENLGQVTGLDCELNNNIITAIRNNNSQWQNAVYIYINNSDSGNYEVQILLRNGINVVRTQDTRLAIEEVTNYLGSVSRNDIQERYSRYFVRTRWEAENYERIQRLEMSRSELMRGDVREGNIEEDNFLNEVVNFLVSTLGGLG